MAKAVCRQHKKKRQVSSEKCRENVKKKPNSPERKAFLLHLVLAPLLLLLGRVQKAMAKHSEFSEHFTDKTFAKNSLVHLCAIAPNSLVQFAARTPAILAFGVAFSFFLVFLFSR